MLTETLTLAASLSSSHYKPYTDANIKLVRPTRASGILPGSLIDKYRGYKYNTATVVRWMKQQQQPSNSLTTSASSVQELEDLAESIVRNGPVAPRHILRTLLKTIKARQEVSSFFRAQQHAEDTHSVDPRSREESNSSHEFFTGILRDIYERLSSQSQRSSSKMQKKGSPTNGGDDKPDLCCSNPFEHLHRADTVRASNECSAHARDHGIHEHDHDNGHGHGSAPCPVEIVLPKHRKAAARISDDLMDEYMALNSYAQQLCYLERLCAETWTEVARSETSMVTAAIMTSAAFKLAQDFEMQLQEYGIRSPEHFQERIEYGSRCLNMQPPTFLSGPGSSGFTFASLVSIWQTLRAFRFDWLGKLEERECAKHGDAQQLPLPIDDDSVYFAVDESTGQRKRRDDGEILTSLLTRMAELISVSVPKVGMPKILCHSMIEQTPLVKELALFLCPRGHHASQLDRDICFDCNTSNISLCFGLQLLLGCSTCCNEDMGQNSIECRKNMLGLCGRMCRVQTLRLANDAYAAIRGLMTNTCAPCDCLHINSKRVIDVLVAEHNTVNRFLRIKRFDSFYQSPWICGFNAAELLHRVSEAGLLAYHHGYFVGKVLHLYHCLVLLGSLRADEFPLMQTLCELFADNVFLGAPPERNLWGCYQRWLGKRVEFPKKRSHRSRMSLSSRCVAKKWSMRCVEDASQGGDNDRRRFEGAKISVTATLMAGECALGDDVLGRVMFPGQSKTAAKDLGRARHMLSTPSSMIDILRRTKAVVRAEVSGASASSTSPSPHTNSGSSTPTSSSPTSTSSDPPSPTATADLPSPIQLPSTRALPPPSRNNSNIPVFRLDHCKVYTTCVSILQALDHAEHPPSEDSDRLCPCVMERLLASTDSWIASGTGPHLTAFEEPELLRNCRAAFVDGLGKSRGVSDWYFDSILLAEEDSIREAV